MSCARNSGSPSKGVSVSEKAAPNPSRKSAVGKVDGQWPDRESEDDPCGQSDGVLFASLGCVKLGLAAVISHLSDHCRMLNLFRCVRTSQGPDATCNTDYQ
jgi:hypothetical protein